MEAMMYGMEHGLELGALNVAHPVPRTCVSAATDIPNVKAGLTIKCSEESATMSRRLLGYLLSFCLSMRLTKICDNIWMPIHDSQLSRA
jgi:hypothetical protein